MPMLELAQLLLLRSVRIAPQRRTSQAHSFGKQRSEPPSRLRRRSPALPPTSPPRPGSTVLARAT
eukprot:14035609-Alexandrium_andersonii.AAC.1